MPQASEESLKRVMPLLRQLRTINGLRETKPGIFSLKGSAFIQFHEDADVVYGELKRSRGGFDRYPVDTPVGQRKLFDDAKRRVDRGDDE